GRWASDVPAQHNTNIKQRIVLRYMGTPRERKVLLEQSHLQDRREFQKITEATKSTKGTKMRFSFLCLSCFFGFYLLSLFVAYFAIWLRAFSARAAPIA